MNTDGEKSYINLINFYVMSYNFTTFDNKKLQNKFIEVNLWPLKCG